MDRASYDAFAEALIAALGSAPGVLGLVAAGSFASGPDAWSDHDFFVDRRTPTRPRRCGATCPGCRTTSGWC